MGTAVQIHNVGEKLSRPLPLLPYLKLRWVARLRTLNDKRAQDKPSATLYETSASILL